MKKIFIASLLTLSLSINAFAQSEELPTELAGPEAQSTIQTKSFPEPDGYVTDLASLLSTETENQLEEMLRKFEGETSTEIAVVSVTDLQGMNIETYTFELGEAWGVGQKEADNGVIFLIAPEQRQTRIEVGYGLEHAIPDVTAYGILRKKILPEFSENNYDAGVLAGVEAIMEATVNENFADQIAGSQLTPLTDNTNAMIFILFILTGWLISIFARSRSWWAGGLYGTVAGVILTIMNFSLWYYIPLLMVIGLFIDYVVSHNHQKSGKTSWWAGGGHSSGSRSGGSFGGGSFGGGGATGRF